MKNQTKPVIFGVVLALAGAVLSARAGDAEFIYTFQTEDTLFTLYDFGDYDTEVSDGGAVFGPGVVEVSFDEPNISVTVGGYALPTEFGAWMSATGENGVARVRIFGDLIQVSETTEVLFEWDSVNTSTSWPGGTYIGGAFLAEFIEGGLGFPDEYIDLINVLPQTSGEEIFTLETGHTYQFFSTTAVDLIEPGAFADVFARISIIDDCPADLTGDGSLNFFDVSAFLNAFSSQDPIADFTGDGSFNFFDVSEFLNSFAAGCP